MSRSLANRCCAFALCCVLSAWLLIGCSHPAERALQGHWYGTAVENFDPEHVPAATGWARGTSLEFEGTRVRISVPAEEPRSGKYELVAIEDRRVTLAVFDEQGKADPLKLIVDDTSSLRWDLGEGRSLVLKRQD